MYFIDVTLDVLCFTRKLIEDITFAAKGVIYYVAIAMVIFSHMKITCYMFLRKTHLVFNIIIHVITYHIGLSNIR